MTKRTLLLTLAIALLAASPASADITVSNVSAAPDNKQAGAHSNFTLSFELGGSTRPSTLEIDLPPGLIGNPNVPAKCTKEQFESDSCPPESKVGTQVVNVSLLGPVASDVNGEVFNLVPPAGEPARLGIKLDAPPPVGTIRLESSVRVRTESDYGLTSRIENLPQDFQINKVTLTLNADANGGKFMTNPTSCNVATTRVRAAGGSDQGSGEGSFTPENCGALAFAPKLSTTIGVDGDPGERNNPTLTSVIEQGPDESNPKSVIVTLGAPLGPNVAALGNVCTVADFNANTCPEKSIVGQANAISPTLPTPLSGPVRIVENPGQLPRIVVYLNGVINIRLAADVGLGSGGTSTTFPSLPDVPLSRFQLDFIGGPNGLVGTTGDLCKNAPTISNELTAHSGKTLSLSEPATVTGCADDGPGLKLNPPLASIRLSRLAGKRPLLVANVKRRTSVSRRLRRVDITLPRGLSFDRRRERVAPVRTTGGVNGKFRGRRTFAARLTPPDDRMGIVVTNGALRVSRSLQRRVKRHPRVTVRIVTVDTAGKKSTLRKRVRIR